MGQTPRHPRISIRLYGERGQLSLLLAYLIGTVDGKVWAFPEPPAHLENLDLRTAYELDPSQIDEISSSSEEERRYLYRVIWHARHG